MSRQAHFLDPYKFQIEEMVKLGCTDEHICRVLEDITGKEVKRLRRQVIVKNRKKSCKKSRRKIYSRTPLIIHIYYPAFSEIMELI